jgi:hypothetical protein
MLQGIARVVLASVLIASAGLKLASPASSRAALATFGLDGERARLAAWGSLVAVELALAGGVAAGLDAAALLAAALMAMFAAVMVSALMRGRAGAPCACFGSRSTVSRPGVARNLALAAAFAGLALLPDGDPTTEQWLGIGIGAALVCCAGLAVAVLALAREVGMLRLRLGPASALEIPEEGPELRVRDELIERFETAPQTELALAVFVSENCSVCRGLEPAVLSLGREPWIAVRTFEEDIERELWSRLGVPGSPYAVALDPAGVVLAKGTFNNLAQLESVLATAERRRAAWTGAEIGLDG